MVNMRILRDGRGPIVTEVTEDEYLVMLIALHDHRVNCELAVLRGVPAEA